MSWKKYTPEVKARPNAPVSISLPDSTGRGSPFLLVDDATMKELGWKGGLTLMLSIGEAEHVGKLRLEPAVNEPLHIRPPSGKAKTKRNRISLGRLPCLGDDKVRSACQFDVEKVTGGGSVLVVTLPDAARSHQLPRGTAAAVALASGKGGVR